MIRWTRGWPRRCREKVILRWDSGVNTEGGILEQGRRRWRPIVPLRRFFRSFLQALDLLLVLLDLGFAGLDLLLDGFNVLLGDFSFLGHFMSPFYEATHWVHAS